MAKRIAGLMVLAALLCLSSGCVKRQLLIESDPPGAKVWINETLAGSTPLTHEFITHGRYKFRLKKTGFQELIAREMVRAPVHQWMPFDFFTENLMPIEFNDEHRFRYKLVPEAPEEHTKGAIPEELNVTLDQLKNHDPEQRRLACLALARARDPQASQALLTATRDSEPIVRAAALEAYRATENLKSTNRLLEVLRLDPSPEVRWTAAIELEAVHDPSTIPGLIGALKDESALVRAGAAEALKAMPDPQSVRPLIAALKDKDTTVRRSSSEALGLIGNKAAVKPLTRTLFHHDFQTRRRAAKSLAMLKDPSAVPALTRSLDNWDPELRKTASQALIEMKDTRSMSTLIRYLRSWKPATREEAAIVLGGLKDSRALKPLERAVLREPNEQTRQAMAQALASLQPAVQ